MTTITYQPAKILDLTSVIQNLRCVDFSVLEVLLKAFNPLILLLTLQVGVRLTDQC